MSRRPVRQSIYAWASVIIVLAATAVFVVLCAYWFGTLS